MRFLLLTISLFVVLKCYSQPTRKIVFSAIVVDTDTVPIPNVAIVSIQTGRTVRTNANGFFQTEITEDDSLLRILKDLCRFSGQPSIHQSRKLQISLPALRINGNEKN